MWVKTERAGISFWQVAEWCAWPWLAHGFTTAGAGNLLEAVNQEKVAEAAGITYPWATVRQVHGSEVAWVDEGWALGRKAVAADGMVTRTPGLALAAFFADCVPLFLVDPETKTIAVSHAGWRGTKDRIGPETVARMVEAGCRVANIQAAVGPSIGPCCYRVSEEMQEFFPAEVFSRRDGQLYLDLWSANVLQLRQAGVDKIFTAEQCTMCSGEEFFSFRRDQTKSRMAAVMALRLGKGFSSGCRTSV